MSDLLTTCRDLVHQYRWLTSLFITSPTWMLYEEWRGSPSAGKRRGAIRCRARDLVIMDRIITRRDPDTGEWDDMLTESVPLATRGEEEV